MCKYFSVLFSVKIMSEKYGEGGGAGLNSQLLFWTHGADIEASIKVFDSVADSLERVE